MPHRYFLCGTQIDTQNRKVTYTLPFGSEQSRIITFRRYKVIQQEQEMILINDLLTVNLGNEERKRCSALGPETEVPLQKRGRDGTMLRSLLGSCGTSNRRRGQRPTITIRLANLTGNNTRKHVKEKGGKWANSRGRKHVRDDLQ